jgi:hypothetical protein
MTDCSCGMATTPVQAEDERPRALSASSRSCDSSWRTCDSCVSCGCSSWTTCASCVRQTTTQTSRRRRDDAASESDGDDDDVHSMTTMMTMMMWNQANSTCSRWTVEAETGQPNDNDNQTVTKNQTHRIIVRSNGSLRFGQNDVVSTLVRQMSGRVALATRSANLRVGDVPSPYRIDGRLRRLDRRRIAADCRRPNAVRSQRAARLHGVVLSLKLHSSI